MSDWYRLLRSTAKHAIILRQRCTLDNLWTVNVLQIAPFYTLICFLMSSFILFQGRVQKILPSSTHLYEFIYLWNTKGDFFETCLSVFILTVQWKSMGTNVVLDTIDFFCVPHKKKRHTGVVTCTCIFILGKSIPLRLVYSSVPKLSELPT